MGCDIHLYVERKVQGVWENAPELAIYDGRNYDLFAILADVRNGRGFAGVITGAGFKVIAQPRGLPPYVSRAISDESEGWGADGHSHSYLSLRELQAFDWDQTTVKCGWVNTNEYKEFKEKGEPSSYCGGISGGMVRKVSNGEMDTAIADGSATSHYYTLVSWESTYRAAALRSFQAQIDALVAASNGDPDSVRIVFWFDN